MPERRPNILLIQADQMAAPLLPFLAPGGASPVQVPTLSRLADEGVVFEAAYCNSPLCAPSRFSMMAGQLASAIAAYDNAAEFPAAVPTFAHHLRLAGYRTGLAGKMHFVGPDQLHGFEFRSTTDIYPADFGWTPDWSRPGARQDYFHTTASVTEAGPAARTMQLDYDEETAYQAGRNLYDLAREADGRPWFLTVSFTHPHDPYNIDPEHWERYEGVEIPLPRVPRLPLAEQDPHSARLLRCYELINAEGEEVVLADADIERARRAYFGAISYIDDKVAELLSTLRAIGAEQDTVVIFTGDHGDMLGERGLWYKMSFFEGSARVPLIVRAPGRFASARVAKPVSLVDLFPTLLDLAGGGDGAAPEPVEQLPGASLLPLLGGDGDAGPTEVLGEYLGEGAAGPLAMIRRGRFKYIAGTDSPQQLFDLDADPDELTNLADDPTHADTAAAFAAEMAERWDFDVLRTAVIANQQRRLLVQGANMTGRMTHWDHQPGRDASQSYVRNTLEILEDLERTTRLPISR